MIIDVSDIITIPMEIEQKILERFQSLPCSIVSKIKECETSGIYLSSVVPI